MCVSSSLSPTYTDASRGFLVAQQQGEQVVLAVGACVGDEGQVWGVGTSVGVASSLLVGVWCGQGVAQTAGALKHLALVIGAVSHLGGGGGEREEGRGRGVCVYKWGEGSKAYP